MAHARKLIHDSAFDADTVKMMGEVFDAAWGEIGPAFRGQSQSTIDDARTVLARSMIQHVNMWLLQPEALEAEAIGAVRQRYPHLRI